MKKSREFLNDCSDVIINIFETTGLSEQRKIVDIAKIMSESAKNSGDYTSKMKDVYDNVYKFLNKMTNSDFQQVFKIATEK